MNVKREAIDRTLAERVMGWTFRQCGAHIWYEDIRGYKVHDGLFSPSTSEADFAECFANAGEELRCECVKRWAARTVETWLMEWFDWIIHWQLAPTSEKARCLYEAVMEKE